MANPRGFLLHQRDLPSHRPVAVRLRDWKEVDEPFSPSATQIQASRCMDCGIAFCHHGCPLGNVIPEWNDLVYRDQWHAAIEALHATNNFPEFTGRLCPAPCEGACVAGIHDDPVTIKRVEVEIIERAFQEGWVQPVRPSVLTGFSVAIIGSGPAGLAAAQQLTRSGHTVTVYERADAIGGLLRYGIPEFKMEKRVLDRRLAQMRAEGTRFVANTWIGGPQGDPRTMSAEALLDNVDAVVIAAGSTVPRDLVVPGRELDGIYQAMDYLPQATRALHERPRPTAEAETGATITDTSTPAISAAGKNVVIIGGGDTGADCLGTALRQGARQVYQFEIMPQPPMSRSDATPWPTFPLVYKITSAHEEGGERRYAVNTTEFIGVDGHVRGLRAVEVDMATVEGRPSFVPRPGTEFTLDAELVLLALGFSGPEPHTVVSALGVALDDRGAIARDGGWQTSVPRVFACGDAGRGQSLIVWAIAEGRSCAAAVDAALMGQTQLPQPIGPTDRPMV